MKKALCMVLILMVVSTVSICFATETSNYAKLPDGITYDTVINEENLYDILEIYNIDTSNVIKKDEPITDDEVTVKDLEKIIKELERMPEKIIDISYDSYYSTMRDYDVRDYPVKVVYRDSDYPSFTMRYTIAGQAYTEPHPPYNSYWMSSEWGNINIQSIGFGLHVEIKEIRLVEDEIYNPGMTNSYLRLNYDYTVDIFLVIENILIPLGEQPIEGYSNFDTSYI